MPGVDDVADELYGVLPADFVAHRDARVKELRKDGDDELAREVKALRRPTVAAWLVNLLARDGLDELSDLSGRMRDAQANLDARAMKDAGKDRSRVVNALVDRAVELARAADGSFRDSEAVREQLVATLVAAVADPGAEAAVTSGRLVTPLSYAGFGEVDISDAVATPLHVVRDEPEARKKSARKKEPEPEGPDPKELERARTELEEAEEALEEAEQAFDEARARRHEARLEVKRAQEALEELQTY